MGQGGVHGAAVHPDYPAHKGEQQHHTYNSRHQGLEPLEQPPSRLLLRHCSPHAPPPPQGGAGHPGPALQVVPLPLLAGEQQDLPLPAQLRQGVQGQSHPPVVKGDQRVVQHQGAGSSPGRQSWHTASRTARYSWSTVPRDSARDRRGSTLFRSQGGRLQFPGEGRRQRTFPRQAGHPLPRPPVQLRGEALLELGVGPLQGIQGDADGLILRLPAGPAPPGAPPRRAARAAGSPTARCSPRAMLLIRSTRSRAAVTAASCSSRLLRGALRPRQALPAWPPGPARPGPPARQTAFWPPPAWSGPDPAAPPGSGPGRGRRSSQTGRTPPGQRRGQGRADRPGCSPAGLSGPPVSPAPPSPVGRPPGLFRPGGGSPPARAAISLPAARAIPGQHLVPPGREARPARRRARTAARASAPQQAAPPRIQGRKLPSSTAPRAADRTSSARPTLRRRGKRRFSLRARSSASRQRGPVGGRPADGLPPPLIPLEAVVQGPPRRACS